jgi:hypothetical protein
LNSREFFLFYYFSCILYFFHSQFFSIVDVASASPDLFTCSSILISLLASVV